MPYDNANLFEKENQTSVGAASVCAAAQNKWQHSSPDTAQPHHLCRGPSPVTASLCAWIQQAAISERSPTDQASTQTSDQTSIPSVCPPGPGEGRQHCSPAPAQPHHLCCSASPHPGSGSLCARVQQAAVCEETCWGGASICSPDTGWGQDASPDPTQPHHLC